MFKYDISVIIPHRDSVSLLPRLFATIPESPRIEIILIDNSLEKTTMQQIRNVGISRDFSLLYSAPERGAGGARNVGIDFSSGKWLVFADADDFFQEGAFDVFFSHLESEAEMIYFCVDGLYPETGERSNRGDDFTNIVKAFRNKQVPELSLRLGYAPPWGKMVNHKLVGRHNLRYDEVLASNDIYFSLLTGYYAKTVEAFDDIVYVVTVTRGSLTRRRDYEVIMSRYKVALRYNRFVKQCGLGEYQKSVAIFLYQARSFGFLALMKMLGMAVQYRQNILIGMSRWIKSYRSSATLDKKELKYIVK